MEEIMENMFLKHYLDVLPEVEAWVKERDPETAAEAWVDICCMWLLTGNLDPTFMQLKITGR